LQERPVSLACKCQRVAGRYPFAQLSERAPTCDRIGRTKGGWRVSVVRRKITAPTASRWVAERRAGVFADPPHPSATWTLTSVRILPRVMNAFAGHFGGGAPAVRQALWGSIYRDSPFPRNEYAAAWKVPQRDLPARLLHRHIHRIASKRAWEAFAAL